jgi:hypothetical protein
MILLPFHFEIFSHNSQMKIAHLLKKTYLIGFTLTNVWWRAGLPPTLSVTFSWSTQSLRPF